MTSGLSLIAAAIPSQTSGLRSPVGSHRPSDTLAVAGIPSVEVAPTVRDNSNAETTIAPK